jgi:hypothetical protein
MELTALAGTGSEVTSTEEDWGFTGVAHDTDVLDRSRVDLNIACSGSGPSSCDECDIRGVNPDAGNCRCANNNRSLCDQPFQVDGDDCGGAVCECYVAPPTPRSNGNTPVCFLDRLANQPDGTWNVDTGVGSVDLQRRRVVYLGETLVEPCPTCSGDVTANDGLREGTCVGGPSDGMSCDANASDATFPAPGGGQYSYDCLPTAGKNVSGSGVKIDTVSLSTASGSLTAGVDCGFTVSPLICHCGLCSGNPSEPCVSDGECAALGAGTCTDIPGSPAVFPNQCDDGVCSDAGGGEGVCTAGPTDTLCDGILRANGEGIINCLSNADCAPGNIGVDAGNCTLSKQRECFLTTIATQGTSDTVQPVASGVACAAKTSNFGVKTVVGLPGASRLRLEAETVFRCSGNPSFAYPSCP